MIFGFDFVGVFLGLSKSTEFYKKVYPSAQIFYNIFKNISLGVCGLPEHLFRFWGKPGHFFIARAMYETDEIPDYFAHQCNVLFNEVRML